MHTYKRTPTHVHAVAHLGVMLGLTAVHRRPAAAGLTAQPGPVELAAAGFGLRRGKDLFAGQRGDAARTCGRSMTASGTHSLICRVSWLTPWRQGLGAGGTAQLRRGQQEGGWAGPGGPLPGGV